MKTSTFYYISLFLLLLSCSQANKKTMHVKSVDIKRKEINFPPSDVLQLKSYYLTSFNQSGPLPELIGYNYKEHALDCINLTSKQITQIPLQPEGPQAIVRPTGIYYHSKDSIWLSDESQNVFLLNRTGDVAKRIDLKAFLDEGEELIIRTNHAMSTIHLGYDPNHQSLLCTIKDKSVKPTRFKVKEISLSNQEVSSFELSASVVEPYIDEGYANMSEPNVSFIGENIIYNYPIESHIYILNRQDGSRKTIEADSEHTPNKANKCSSKTDYSAWVKHGFENPHFYDVMYIPSLKMYVRLHAGPIDLPDANHPEEVAYKRSLYAMFFDSAFQSLGETVLPQGIYNPYTGWSATPSGIAFFVDGPQSPNETDNLELEIVSPN